MNIKDILSIKVSFQQAAWTPIVKEVTIEEVLNDIKNGTYSGVINFLRAFLEAGETDKYSIYKKKLPAITFCGTFNGERKKELIKEYNYIVVLDIDDLEKEELNKAKTALQNDEYVLTSWTSPSNKGLKGLVAVSYLANIDLANIDSYHKHAFKKIKDYFSERYNIILDNSGSDTTRLCFVSHDANLNIKDIFKIFEINHEDIKTSIENVGSQGNATKEVRSINKKDALYSAKNRNNSFHRKTIQSVIRYLKKYDKSITSTYEEWYRVGLAIANSFTYPIGEKYFLSLCSLDKEKFNETNCKNMLVYLYENNKDKIRFNTIEYLATQKGYKIQNQKEAVPKVPDAS